MASLASEEPEVDYLELSGLKHRILSWRGRHAAQTPAWLLLHGWLDQADGFRRLAGRLLHSGPVHALDFRGHGHSEWVGRGGYYHFIDYVRDLRDLVDQLQGLATPFDLVGHSMGGTVATYFAGTCPQLVRGLALLEGTGPVGLQPEQAPARTRRWLIQLARGRKPGRIEDVADATRRLQRVHPELPESILRDMATRGTVADVDRRRWRYDPLHTTQSPTPFQAATYCSYARHYTGPVLQVYGDQSWMTLDPDPSRTRREGAFSGPRQHTLIAGAAHMLHLSHPAQVAECLLEWRRSRPHAVSGTL